MNAGDLRVVGLDPGLANLGLGAVAEDGKGNVRFLGCELVRTSARDEQGKRLLHLFTSVSAFLKQHQPHVLALEGQYFHQQREVAFKVGQAYGVCLLAAEQQGLTVAEYGPMQVKQALVGTGRADKAQIAFMVRAILGPAAVTKGHHVTDALALALTHLNAHKVQRRLEPVTYSG